MKNKKLTIQKTLSCNVCYLTITILRLAGKNRKEGHIKHMWCPMCQKITAHTECNEFKEAFEC